MKQNIRTSWQLLRGTNLLLLVASLWLLLFKANIDLPWAYQLALLIGTASVAAAGNLLNDIADQALDALHPIKERLVGVRVNERQAWRWYGGLNVGALFLVVTTQNSALLGSFVLSIGLLYAYSRFWKCCAWWGNVVVALLCALSLLQLLVVMPGQWNKYWQITVTIYASFAFLTNWWRELIKDIEDESSDRTLGCSTLVVQRGRAYSLNVAHRLCNALLVGLVLGMGFLWQFIPWRATIYIILVLLPATVYLKNALKFLFTTDAVHQFSQALKGYMLLGLLGVCFL